MAAAATGNIAFKMKLKSVREDFFDRPRIINALDEVTHKRLSQFGAFVMKRARGSMRDTKRQASLPGQPPRSHVGLLKRGGAAVTFSYDTNLHKVTIGPTLINRPTGAPEKLEYGGTISVEGHTIFVKRRAGRDAKGRFVSRGVDKQELHGTRRIAPRPYMAPAFAAELDKHMDKWKDSIR